MKFDTRKARAWSLALVTALGVLFAAAPALAAGEDGLSGVVNINTATSEELQLLPGIGEARAREVIALRKRNGGFKSVDELSQIKGIGDVALERIRPFARVEGKTTAQRK